MTESKTHPKKIANNTDLYVDYWNLEAEEEIDAPQIKKIALGLIRYVGEIKCH